MNIRIVAASVLALSLLAPAAFAGNNFGNPNAPAGSQVTNQQADYPLDAVDAGSSQALVGTSAIESNGHFNTGDFIDETNAERNQRSSN